MTIIKFSIWDKFGKIQFFEEIFLLADTSIEVVLNMLFLILSNAEIQFDTRSFTWRTYNIADALLITKQVKLINKDKSIKVAFDKNSEMFIIHIIAFKVLEVTKIAKMLIYPDQTIYIQVTVLS